MEKPFNNVYVYNAQNSMSAKERRPIQLKPNVKEKFDKIHKDLKQETQSETVEVLIDFYRTNGMKIQV